MEILTLSFVQPSYEALVFKQRRGVYHQTYPTAN